MVCCFVELMAVVVVAARGSKGRRGLEIVADADVLFGTVVVVLACGSGGRWVLEGMVQ